jgi:hypothetical protein
MSQISTSSAFVPYTNATLTVRLAQAPSAPGQINSGWITDPATGNFTFDQSTADQPNSLVEEFIYQAHLCVTQPPQYNRSLASDSSTFYLAGMLLNPWSFDPLIKPNQLFDCIWNRLSGTFEMLPEQSVLPDFQSILGTRLKGIFRITAAGISQT